MPDNSPTPEYVEAETATAVQTVPEKETKRKKQPRYHVILWDDDDHSYEYVELMMRRLFGHAEATCHKIARTVDHAGKAVCLTTTREHAELKRDQILAFGPDVLIARCRSSMKASIEPAPEE
jgi:ATP-dependent Clp protease adaptor protein ClpS